ncbi:MAG: LuxR C-terminal-related transcriptional regulator [Pseudomonadota bacterium]
MQNQLIDLATALGRAETADEAWEATCKTFSAIGFDEATWGHVDPKSSTIIDMRSTLSPQEWERYANTGKIENDPIVRAAAARDHPFFDHYDDYVLEALPDALRVRLEGNRANRLPARVYAPMPRLRQDDPIGLLALGADIEAESYKALLTSERRLLAFALQFAISRLAQLASPVEPLLTPREADCLLHLAQGQRNARIAEQLGISTATVEMHLANARRKLGAKTREQAVALAIMGRHICP